MRTFAVLWLWVVVGVALLYGEALLLSWSLPLGAGVAGVTLFAFGALREPKARRRATVMAEWK